MRDAETLAEPHRALACEQPLDALGDGEAVLTGLELREERLDGLADREGVGFELRLAPKVIGPRLFAQAEGAQAVALAFALPQFEESMRFRLVGEKRRSRPGPSARGVVTQ